MAAVPESPPTRLEIRVVDDRMRVIGPLTVGTLRRPDRKTRRAFTQVRSVDLSEVPFMDSAGVAQLIEWKRLALKQGRSLEVRNLPDQARAIARLCQVEDFLLKDLPPLS
jgi:ABC-type transporter Mla MlaB component